MSKKSTFGAKPEQLKRLLTAIGLEKSSASEQSDQTASSAPSMGELEDRIGRYKLLSVLGEGGMGIVYLAEQQRPIRRQVALKVIKPGMDSKRVIARFEAERQALALLDHPNIAHVHDAGTTEAGRPYFVMEYVKGLPITEHCDRHKLTIEDRLNLFRQVCHAVHHAHQKGIIHRDVKPSNILVSIVNDRAIPKIIDFGVAKAIAQPLTERTLATEGSQLLGTPEYMSPEQADMANEDIDTRSDIYSLGVLLYVLLTGALPFDSKILREGGVEHIRHVIRETDPKTPSTRLSSLGEEAKKVAQSRRTEIATLAKKLHKELEWIPLKAMHKERAERYRSASELADDIDNYLKGAPLIAGPLTAAYRFKKFVRRNRALVTGIAAVMAVLIAGIIVSTIFAMGQAHARTEAQTIADFLKNDVLASVGPGKAKGQDITVRYVLDAASENLEGRFEDKPLVEASIRDTLGWTYRMLGEFEAAETHLERALQIREQQLGERHPETLDSMHSLGWIYSDQGLYKETERLWAKAAEGCQRVLGQEHPVTLYVSNALAFVYYNLGRYQEAERLFVKTVEISHRVLGEGGGWLDKERGLTLFAMGNLAWVHTAQGRYKNAEQQFLKTLEIGGRVWGEESIWMLLYTSRLAWLYRAQGRYEEAVQLLVKTLEKQRLVLGEEHRYTLGTMNRLGWLYTDQGRYDEAKTLFSEALQIARGRHRLEHPVTLRLVNGLAVLHTKQKQYDEAERLFDEALKGRQRELGDDHPDTLESKNDLALLYKEQNDYNKAAPLLLEAVEGRRLKLGDTHPHTLESWNNLIELYEAWNKPEKAEEWRAKLPQTEAVEE